MQSPWDYPDFDDHEIVHFVHDRASGLRAIIAVHSTHLGPGAGGVRFWNYAATGDALAGASHDRGQALAGTSAPDVPPAPLSAART